MSCISIVDDNLMENENQFLPLCVIYQIAKWLYLPDYQRLRISCKFTMKLNSIPCLSFRAYIKTTEMIEKNLRDNRPVMRNVQIQLDSDNINFQSMKYLVGHGHVQEFIRIMKTHANKVDRFTKMQVFNQLVFSQPESNFKLWTAKILIMAELVNNRYGIDSFPTRNKILKNRFVLHQACHKGFTDLVKKIVTYSPENVNNKTLFGLSPLNVAIRYFNVDIALFLLNSGADPIRAEGSEWEPIHNATRLGLTQVLQSLLQKVSPTSTTDTGLQPIHVAAHYGIIGSLNVLLKDQRVTIRSKNEAYQISKMKQYNDFAEILYNKLHPEKSKKELLYLDPLHIAAINCDLEFIKHIFHLQSISKNWNEIDLNVRDAKGCTPLHHAIRAGSYIFARMLIEHERVDIMAENQKGELPIHFAAKFGRLCIIKHLLMFSKVHPDVRSNRYVFFKIGKAQPIVLAARNLRHAEVKELLSTGKISIYSKLSAKRAALSSILKQTWYTSDEDMHNNDILWDQMRQSFMEIWYAIVDCIAV